MKWLPLLFVFFSACVSHTTRKFTPEPHRTLLFPKGIYYHLVTIEPVNAKPQTFNGIVGITEERLTVVGLSPFATTLFRIEEDRQTGKVEVDIFHSSLKKHEKKLREFYAVLKVLMILKLGSPAQVKSKDVILEFSDFDENRIPMHLEIRHPKYRVRVEVTGYET